jgi:hypothetical protein
MTKNCRICNTNLSKSTDFLSLPNCPLTDEFALGVADPNLFSGYISDINIICCDNCKTVQNPQDFHYSDYYADYAYSSGSSLFTKVFMAEYAAKCIDLFKQSNNALPVSVIEPGSGDGEQLKYFKECGLVVRGVEPSLVLASHADKQSIRTDVALFNKAYVESIQDKYDICISSYTLDHCPDPVEYLISTNKVLNLNGIMAFEVHDLSRILDRAEYCLFEHEHTIYLNQHNAKNLIEACGFEVLDINPIPSTACRANSLIMIARKTAECSQINIDQYIQKNSKVILSISLNVLQQKINRLKESIDNWLDSTPGNIVGYGAGGRGVMTLAQLENAHRISIVLDFSYSNRHVRTPKTLIPVVGPEYFSEYCNASVLVFSFGYFAEVHNTLVENGFDSGKVLSLEVFMNKL